MIENYLDILKKFKKLPYFWLINIYPILPKKSLDLAVAEITPISQPNHNLTPHNHDSSISKAELYLSFPLVTLAAQLCLIADRKAAPWYRWMIVVHVEFPKRPLSLSLPLLVSINNRHPRRRIMRSGVLLPVSVRRLPPIWSMITDDKQFHTVPRLHTWQINWYTTECVTAYLRRRNAAFHTLRSLLLGVVSGRRGW